MAAAERAEGEVRGAAGGGGRGAKGAGSGVEVEQRRAAAVVVPAGGGGRARVPADEEGLPHLPQRAARLGAQPAAPGHLGAARARAGERGRGGTGRARGCPPGVLPPGAGRSQPRLSAVLPPQVQSENELEVLSILPHGWQPDEPVQPRPYLLVPSTRVTFLARQYRFVIELDLSPSTGIVVSAGAGLSGGTSEREKQPPC